MSTKIFLRILIFCGLLVMVFLVVQVVSETPASARAVVPAANLYAGSDWIERHPGGGLP